MYQTKKTHIMKTNEKLISGVLCRRNDNIVGWKPIPYAELAGRLTNQYNTIAQYQRINADLKSDRRVIVDELCKAYDKEIDKLTETLSNCRTLVRNQEITYSEETQRLRVKLNEANHDKISLTKANKVLAEDLSVARVALSQAQVVILVK